MTKIEKLKILLRSMHPRMWGMNKPYSARLDEAFRQGLENGDRFEFVATSFLGKPLPLSLLTVCHANFGPIRRVWIRNYPYACFTVDGGPPWADCRPSRRTIVRLYDRLVKDLNEAMWCCHE